MSRLVFIETAWSSHHARGTRLRSTDHMGRTPGVRRPARFHLLCRRHSRRQHHRYQPAMFDDIDPAQGGDVIQQAAEIILGVSSGDSLGHISYFS